MVEITILLDIREQAVYLGQEDMVLGEFKPSLQNYKIGKFCVITLFLSQLSKNSKEETNFVLCSQRYWQTFRAENARFGIAKRKKVMENTRLFQVLYRIARKCS